VTIREFCKLFYRYVKQRNVQWVTRDDGDFDMPRSKSDLWKAESGQPAP